MQEAVRARLVTHVRGRAEAAAQALEALVAHPSVAGRDLQALRDCAQTVGALLADAGAPVVELLEVVGAPPAVWAEVPGPPGAPTVLLYTHYDVQPPGDLQRWSNEPFRPMRRDGRLYGRGAADNKAATVVHAEAIRAWLTCADGPPVTVRVLVEGEEELGSPHLDGLLATHGDRLACDVAVVPDAANWGRGWPALTTSVRGLAQLTVTVRTLDRPLHSGVWGGAAPDALFALGRLLACLHDDDGRPAVPGFDAGLPAPTSRQRAAWAALEAGEEQLREEAGLAGETRWVPDDDVPLVARRWARPALTVTAVDAPAVADAANQLVDVARARISVRVAPGQDPQHLVDALIAHLGAHVPVGAELHVDGSVLAQPWQVDAAGPEVEAVRAAAAAAFGRELAVIGGGGSIALVPQLHHRLGAVCLLTGMGDPDMNAHAEDESMPLDDLVHAAVAETLLLGELADRCGGHQAS